jgi:hypothetical protein
MFQLDPGRKNTSKEKIYRKTIIYRKKTLSLHSLLMRAGSAAGFANDVTREFHPSVMRNYDDQYDD